MRERTIEHAREDFDRRLDRGRPVFAARYDAHRACPQPARAVTHEHGALLFHLDGSAVIEQRTRWTLGAGDVLLVPAGEPHRLVHAEGAARWGLGLCPVCLAADGAAELLEPFERVRAGGAAVVSIPEARRAHLAGLFAELARESALPAPQPAVQRALLTLILTEVARAAAWPAEAPRPDVAADALRFIERRCLEPISARDVAEAVRRTPAHLTTVLRRATGRSAQEWIIAGRMSEARRRLLHGDELVEIVAERVGYADATHFIRLFRRMHGMTPAAWRAAQRAVPELPPPAAPA